MVAMACLIERSLSQDPDGDVRIAFEPGGIICTVDAPLAPDGLPSAGSGQEAPEFEVGERPEG
jgi:hypothetical protein